MCSLHLVDCRLELNPRENGQRRQRHSALDSFDSAGNVSVGRGLSMSPSSQCSSDRKLAGSRVVNISSVEGDNQREETELHRICIHELPYRST